MLEGENKKNDEDEENDHGALPHLERRDGRGVADVDHGQHSRRSRKNENEGGQVQVIT